MSFQKIFEFFPPPTFLYMPYSGISISDSAIRCVQFGRKGKELFVLKYAEKPLPMGAVVSGYINNTEEVVAVLSQLKKELNIGYVKASLPEEKAYLFNTKIPIVGRKKVRNEIEYTIEENVPLPASELVFDYAVTSVDSESENLHVVVSALPIKIVDSYVEAYTKAGISLLSLEIESQAIARAMLPNNPGSFLIVHFGKEKVGFYVATNKVIRFTSTLSMKGEMGGIEGFLTQEIKKLFIYWNTLKQNVGRKEAEIQQIVLCGEDFDDTVGSYVSSHNKVPVILGNVWKNAFDINITVPPISFKDSLRYPAAVGLALPVDILM